MNRKTSGGRWPERYGCYPERILADKIYRTRQTLAFCKEHAIRLSGPALGKPPQNLLLSRQTKKLKYQDSCDRNVVEGVSVRPRPFMDWAVSWHACKNLLSVSLALTYCS